MYDDEMTKKDESKWGEDISDAELMQIGFKAGDVVGQGEILDIKKYDVDGEPYMAKVKNADGVEVMINVSHLQKL